MKIFLLFFLIYQIKSITKAELQAYETEYGATVTGEYPNYYERYIHHYWNMVRLDCHEYVDLGYTVWNQALIRSVVCDSSQLSWPQPAVWTHPKLVEVARDQAYDLTENCKVLQHDSCDGTSAGTRVYNKIGPGCSMSSEIAWSAIRYTKAVDGWLCEISSTSKCEVGGHTLATFSSRSKLGGAGMYSKSATTNSYIIGDFSGCNLYDTDEEIPIASATWQTNSDGGFKMLAMFYSDTAATIQGAVVVINGKKYALTNDFGISPTKGNYVADIPGSLNITEGCQTLYHFEFLGTNATGSQKHWYYPRKGSLTLGKDCAQSYYEGHMSDGSKFPWEPWYSTTELVIILTSAIGGGVLLSGLVFGFFMFILFFFSFRKTDIKIANINLETTSNSTNKKKNKETNNKKSKKKENKTNKSGNKNKKGNKYIKKKKPPPRLPNKKPQRKGWGRK